MTLPRDTPPAPVFPTDSTCQDDSVEGSLLHSITIEEINKCFPRNNSAPSPDNSFVRDLKKISRSELLKIYNIFLLCRKVPQRFCIASTLFLPKKSDAVNPGDFRPISLTSILAQLFSKILSGILSPATRVDPEQRGFMETDGICQNNFLLDFVLRHAPEKTKRTYIASLDIRKAFHTKQFTQH
ncbi:Retrovirus-related Pol polyprotein from type-2 retrotransposable element R2DM [Araneus ventricosus]|uniref:Retrovirus-related Pol polyprotein from type-2 retrotransposable element R2DM n=1 Tax=Araneus ventricosus TaxID=182803 RepID=A0A4Y2Q4B0_ARAVE|nr:Retrovirus-related Pol polyprotein from type-2 retrotransposable element R2DM [Araneus ventricosus]